MSVTIDTLVKSQKINILQEFIENCPCYTKIIKYKSLCDQLNYLKKTLLSIFNKKL